MKKFKDIKFHFTEAAGQLTEGKMNELSVDIGDHMDKHISNYKKFGGAEDLMAKAHSASKKIAKLHKIKPEHAHRFVRDYIESSLSEAVVVAEGSEILKVGTAVRVPHKGKMVPGKIVRHDPGKGGYSPAYVVNIGEYESKIVPVHHVKQGVAEGFLGDITDKNKSTFTPSDKKEKTSLEKSRDALQSGTANVDPNSILGRMNSRNKTIKDAEAEYMNMKKEEVELTEGRPSQRHPLEGHDEGASTDKYKLTHGKSKEEIRLGLVNKPQPKKYSAVDKIMDKAKLAFIGNPDKGWAKPLDKVMQKNPYYVKVIRPAIMDARGELEHKISGEKAKPRYELTSIDNDVKESYLPNEENLDEMTIAGLRTSRDLVKHLKGNGWSINRTTGGHDVYVHATNKNNIAVPRHKGDLAPGTVRNILKTAGLHKEGFQSDFLATTNSPGYKQWKLERDIESGKVPDPNFKFVPPVSEPSGTFQGKPAQPSKDLSKEKYCNNCHVSPTKPPLTSPKSSDTKKPSNNNLKEWLGWGKNGKEIPPIPGNSEKTVPDKPWIPRGPRHPDRPAQRATPASPGTAAGKSPAPPLKSPPSPPHQPDDPLPYDDDSRIVHKDPLQYDKKIQTNVPGQKYTGSLKDMEMISKQDAEIKALANQPNKQTYSISYDNEGIAKPVSTRKKEEQESSSLKESRKADIVKDAWKSAKSKKMKDPDDQSTVDSKDDPRKDTFQRDPEMSSEIVKQ